MTCPWMILTGVWVAVMWLGAVFLMGMMARSFRGGSGEYDRAQTRIESERNAALPGYSVDRETGERIDRNAVICAGQVARRDGLVARSPQAVK